MKFCLYLSLSTQQKHFNFPNPSSKSLAEMPQIPLKSAATIVACYQKSETKTRLNRIWNFSAKKFNLNCFILFNLITNAAPKALIIGKIGFLRKFDSFQNRKQHDYASIVNSRLWRNQYLWIETSPPYSPNSINCKSWEINHYNSTRYKQFHKSLLSL